MRPKRIQRKRTKGWRMPSNTVYVGRGSKWGNPFKITKREKMPSTITPWGWRVYERGTAWRFFCKSEAVEFTVKLHKKYIRKKIKSGELNILELKDKNLACWCPLEDKDGNKVACHADLLLELANK